MTERTPEEILRAHQPKHAAPFTTSYQHVLAEQLSRPDVTPAEYRRALELAFTALTARDAEIGELNTMLREYAGHSPDLAKAEAGWAEVTAQVRGWLLTSPEGHALYKTATQVHAEFRAEIARLRAELDKYEGRQVVHCLDRDMTKAIESTWEAEGGPPEGTLIRATDTGRELEWKAGAWLPRT